MAEKQDFYYELDIAINPMLEDILSEFFFNNFDCEGVVLYEETYKNLELVSSTEGTLRVFLKNFNKNDFKKKFENFIELLKSRGLNKSDLGSLKYIIEEKKSEDWSKKWKENWTVTHVTDKITVVPDWIEYKPKQDEIIIKLEPGCAFGTGTHQTTQLCMKAIEKYLKKGDNFADIGTGSGILAILAKKIGADFVYGCDNDETVIPVAKENAKKNCADCVFELNTADKITKNFNFVCANILHNVLDEIMGDLKKILKPDGILLLSGILDEKRQIVIDAITRENLKIVEEIHQDQWTSFVVRK